VAKARAAKHGLSHKHLLSDSEISDKESEIFKGKDKEKDENTGSIVLDEGNDEGPDSIEMHLCD